MLHKLWEGFQLVFVIAVFAIFLLSKTAAGNPRLAWLKKLELKDHRTEEQKRRARRSQNIMGGLEMILLGLALPPLYLFSTVFFFFSGTNTLVLAGTIAMSVIMIFIGVRAIVTSRGARV